MNYVNLGPTGLWESFPKRNGKLCVAVENTFFSPSFETDRNVKDLVGCSQWLCPAACSFPCVGRRFLPAEDALPASWKLLLREESCSKMAWLNTVHYSCREFQSFLCYLLGLTLLYLLVVISRPLCLYNNRINLPFKTCNNCFFSVLSAQGLPWIFISDYPPIWEQVDFRPRCFGSKRRYPQRSHPEWAVTLHSEKWGMDCIACVL